MKLTIRKMNDQQNHLEYALSQQKVLLSEIQELNNSLTSKREQFLKLQGIVEYLNSLNMSTKEVSSNETEQIENKSQTP